MYDLDHRVILVLLILLVLLYGLECLDVISDCNIVLF